MHIHPDIAMLRSYPKAQHRPASPLLDGRDRPRPELLSDLLPEPLVTQLAAFGAGGALPDAPLLAPLLSDFGTAQALVEAVIGKAMAALVRAPLGLLPFGHALRPGLARLRLAQRGRATLTLLAYDRRAPSPRPAAVLFEDGESHEIAVAGHAAAVLHRLTPTGLDSRDMVFGSGQRIALTGAAEARQILAVRTPLLVLRLSRTPVRPAPTREIAVPGGQLVRASSGCKRASRAIVALGVLGVLAHAQGASLMERLALDPDEPRDLRWEALRQLLALDAEAGMALLGRLASEPGGALAGPAAALWRNLVSSRPELTSFVAAGELA